MSLINLLDLSLADLFKTMTSLGEPSFRVKQIAKWLYQKRVNNLDEMTNLSKASREKIAGQCVITKLPVSVILESQDKDAVKFGFIAHDSQWTIESVLLIDGDRRTACLSSQIGCNLGCVFCVTGKVGFIRNLSQSEIIGQLICINDYLLSKNDKPVTNIVFMGMGEALSNFDTFITSLEIIQSEDAFFIGSRRITVSTAGVIPSIKKLMDRNLTIGLAISLNTYNNEKRSAIMPINNSYPIESLVAIAKEYVARTGRIVTFEYVLVKNENDSLDAITALFSLLAGMECKINVIPLNPGDDDDEKCPSREQVRNFVQSLVDKGLNAIARKSRGKDIKGACGQLFSTQFIKKN